mmetsp:Transcript_25413/g.50694  ORF Transcript_25413/g.50694 Transcript_25413/m.50694 type:complete len:611 (+) Transcript_25413:169-2001(+)
MSMISYIGMKVTFLVLLLAPPTASFAPAFTRTRRTTELNIIGGAIRKMRAEQEKKKMPMASPEDAAQEAPGLRVGPQAWKWPPVWPYDDELFRRPDEEEAVPSALEVATQSVKEDDQEERIEKSKEDSILFWKSEPETIITDDCAANLAKHLDYYLSPSDAVAEFCPGAKSYFTTSVSSHIGLGLSPLASSNPSLTSFLEVNLNDAPDESPVPSVPADLYGTFDKVICLNGVDFLQRPREVMKTAHGLLKDGGTCIFAFSDRGAYKDAFGAQQTKMWRTMTDDQHMWVLGSFFHFSAGSGWSGLKGFDISPPKPANFIQEKLANVGGMYVVQAKKSAPAPVTEADPEVGLESLLWTTPVLESRDKMLLVPRLARLWSGLPDAGRRAAIEGCAAHLPKVYELLAKMDSFAFPFNLQATLAADLVSEPGFDSGDEGQMDALAQGLGLNTPGPEWTAVGTGTSSLKPEDKVSLLAYIVPRSGNGRLGDFATGLQPTANALEGKGMSRADAELVASELLAKEVLDGGMTRSDFAAWITAMPLSEAQAFCSARMEMRAVAERDLATYIREKEEEEKRRQEEEEAMKAQVEKAREERTTYFDEETGQMRFAGDDDD